MTKLFRKFLYSRLGVTLVFPAPWHQKIMSKLEDVAWYFISTKEERIERAKSRSYMTSAGEALSRQLTKSIIDAIKGGENDKTT